MYATRRKADRENVAAEHETTTMELTSLPRVLLLLTPAGITEEATLDDIVVKTGDGATAGYQLDAVVLWTKLGTSLSRQSSQMKGRNHYEVVVWPDAAKEPQTLWHFDDLAAVGKRITTDYLTWITIVRKLGHLFVWSRTSKPTRTVQKSDSNSAAMSDL